MMKNLRMKSPKKTLGFTLIELLVVVSVLAAIAGMTSVALDGYQQDAEEKLTRVDMQRIANAIRRFKEDTGYWPKTESAGLGYKSSDAANFSFLFNMPSGMNAWDVEYAIGWHGPYIDFPAIKTVAFDNINTPSIDCASANSAIIANFAQVDGLVDRFKQNIRYKISASVDFKYCPLVKLEGISPIAYVNNQYSGSPYLYQEKFTDFGHNICTKDSDPNKSITCVALLSFGKDGVDNNGSDNSDDIVFILQVNPKLGES